MGQIVQKASNPVRCNLAAIQTGGSQANVVLDDGEVWFVDTTNAEKGTDGYGHYDAYIVGDGTKKASALEVRPIDDMSAFATKQELAAKQDVINDLATIRSGAQKGNTAYQKPSGGIPASDMASAVQTSLGKADAAAPQSTTYTKTEVDAALALKQTSSQLATINGSRIDQGGNVSIVAAEGQTITIDATPTEGSSNAVSSGGVWNAILNESFINDIDINELSELNYIITSSDKWGINANGKHILLPVTAGMTLLIEGATEKDSSYAFLTSSEVTSGGTPPFVINTTRYSITSGSSVIITIPESCIYLYLTKTTTSSGTTITGWLPRRVGKIISFKSAYPQLLADIDNLEGNPLVVTQEYTRLQKSVTASPGIYRVLVEIVSGTPTIKNYRVYSGTAASASRREVSRYIPFGQSCVVPVLEGDTQLYLYSASDSATLTFKCTLVRLDTDRAKQLDGRKVLVMGDSISAFGDEVNAAGQEALSWSQILSALMPGATVTNIAIGGTCLRKINDLSLNPSSNNTAYSALSMVELANAISTPDYNWQYQDAAVNYLGRYSSNIARAKAVDISSIDYVLILGGTNDWGAQDGDGLGTSTSVNDKETLGAVNLIIDRILGANGRIKLFFISPPVRYKAGTMTDANWSDNYEASGSGQNLRQFVATLQELCKSRHIPFLDIYNNIGWNQVNFATFFNTAVDTTHPYWGFREIAEYVHRNVFV